MKRGIADHPKTEELAARLDLPVAFVVGVLEMLCNQWAPRCAPKGDIGKWTDEQIARGIRCGIPADKLIPALVASGWLDAHRKYRLVIHDFHEHADNSVRKYLKRHDLEFVSTRPANVRTSLDNGDPPRAGNGYGLGNGQAMATGKGKAPEGFDRFWSLYPRKEGKGDARKAWAALRPTADLVETICAAVEQQAASLKWRAEPQFIPGPGKWLRHERWADVAQPLPLTTGKTATNIQQAAAWASGGRRDAS